MTSQNKILIMDTARRELAKKTSHHRPRRSSKESPVAGIALQRASSASELRPLSGPGSGPWLPNHFNSDNNNSNLSSLGAASDSNADSTPVEVGSGKIAFGSSQMTALGVFLFMRLPVINARAGAIVSISLLAIISILIYWSVDIVSSHAHLSKLPSVLFSMNTKYLGTKLGISIGLAQLLSSILTTVLYAVAASELLSTFPAFGRIVTSESYLYIDQAWDWSRYYVLIAISVVILAACGLLPLVVPRKFINFIFATAPIIAGVLYIADFAFMIYANANHHSVSSSRSKDYSVLPLDKFSFHEFFSYFALILVPFSGLAIDATQTNQKLQSGSVMDNIARSSRPLIIASSVLLAIYSLMICFLLDTDGILTNRLVLGRFNDDSEKAFKILLIIVYIGTGFRFYLTSTELLTSLAEKASFIPIFRLLISKKKRMSYSSLGETMSPNNFSESANPDDVEMGKLEPSNHSGTTVSDSKLDNSERNNTKMVANIKEFCLDNEIPKYPVYVHLSVFLLSSVFALIGSLDVLSKVFAITFMLIISSIQVIDILVDFAEKRERKSFNIFRTLFKMASPFVLGFLVSWWIAVIVYTVMFCATIYICQQDSTSDWGELLYQFVSEISFKLFVLTGNSREKADNLNWRPQFQVVVTLNESDKDELYGVMKLSKESEEMIKLASQIGNNLVVTAFAKGDSSLYRNATHSRSLDYLRSFLKKQCTRDGICSVTVSSNIPAAVETGVQILKFGRSSPNAILQSWPSDWESRSAAEIEEIYSQFKLILSVRKAIVLLKGAVSLPNTANNSDEIGGTIDIWWVVHDGGILLLLPYLLTLNKSWSNTKLRLFVVLSRIEDNPEKFRQRASRYLKQVRINAEVTIVDISNGGDMAWVYEQTIDVKTRIQLLKSLNSKPTVTMAMQSDTVWGGSSSSYSVPHVADIFNLPRNDYSSNSNTSTSSRQSVENSISRNNRRNSDSKSKGANVILANSTISSTIANSIPVSEYLVSEPELIEASLREESKRISQKHKTDVDRTYVALLLNKQIMNYSKDAKLVVTNFPLVRNLSAAETLSYVDTLTKDIAPVMLVRGTGSEFITTY